MIILHAANFDRKTSYRSMYNCDYKIRNGMIRNGHALYSFSDRDVARDSNPLHIRKLGVASANRKFIAICETIRPDLILLGHADIITNATLKKVKEINKGVKIACYNVDPLFVPSNFAAIMHRAEVADTMYITTGGKEIQQFSVNGMRAFFLPNPVDMSVEAGRAFESSAQENDVIFCTVRSKITDPRVQFMLALKERLPGVNFGLYGMLGNPSVFGAKYLQVIQNAKMAVNISKTCGDVGHSREHNYLYSSDRIAHITGNGLLTFADRTAGFDALYSEEEMVFFDSVEDLAEKIQFYKENDAERRRIAKGGWQKAHGEFNEKRISQYMVETTFTMKLSQPYIWSGM